MTGESYGRRGWTWIRPGQLPCPPCLAPEWEGEREPATQLARGAPRAAGDVTGGRPAEASGSPGLPDGCCTGNMDERSGLDVQMSLSR